MDSSNFLSVTNAEKAYNDIITRVYDAKVAYDRSAAKYQPAAADNIHPTLAMTHLGAALVFILSLPDTEEYYELIQKLERNLRSTFTELESYFSNRLTKRESFNRACTAIKNELDSLNTKKLVIEGINPDSLLAEFAVSTDLKPKCQRCQKFKR